MAAPFSTTRSGSSIFADGVSADQEHDANSALTELDKGIITKLFVFFIFNKETEFIDYVVYFKILFTKFHNLSLH